MTTEKRTLNITEIKEYLPHRYPLLLVDRVLDVEADWQPAASSFMETRAAFDLVDSPLPLNTTQARVRVATVDGVFSSSMTATLQLPAVLPAGAPCDVGEAFAQCPTSQVCVDAMPFAQCTAE